MPENLIEQKDIKFESRYGTEESVLNNVYKPLLLMGKIIIDIYANSEINKEDN